MKYTVAVGVNTTSRTSAVRGHMRRSALHGQRALKYKRATSTALASLTRLLLTSPPCLFCDDIYLSCAAGQTMTTYLHHVAQTTCTSDARTLSPQLTDMVYPSIGFISILWRVALGWAGTSRKWTRVQ